MENLTHDTCAGPLRRAGGTRGKVLNRPKKMVLLTNHEIESRIRRAAAGAPESRGGMDKEAIRQQGSIQGLRVQDPYFLDNKKVRPRTRTDPYP